MRRSVAIRGQRALWLGAGVAGMLALGGCGLGIGARKAPSPAAVAPIETAIAPLPKPAAASAEAYDTTTAAERAAAVAPQAGGARLGTTIASLGDPTAEGFWLKTGLVSAPAKGRVVLPATGASVSVDLIPSGGAAGGGSQMSLPALRLLGVSLTDLPEVEVFRL